MFWCAHWLWLSPLVLLDESDTLVQLVLLELDDESPIRSRVMRLVANHLHRFWGVPHGLRETPSVPVHYAGIVHGRHDLDRVAERSGRRTDRLHCDNADDRDCTVGLAVPSANVLERLVPLLPNSEWELVELRRFGPKRSVHQMERFSRRHSSFLDTNREPVRTGADHLVCTRPLRTIGRRHAVDPRVAFFPDRCRDFRSEHRNVGKHRQREKQHVSKDFHGALLRVALGSQNAILSLP